ncbi:MAG: hypothetical protein ACP5LW_03870 [Nitrososphaeria archaeon]
MLNRPVCLFDFGYPRSFEEVMLLSQNLGIKNYEKAIEMYTRVGFSDVDSKYREILSSIGSEGEIKIGYLFLPPYIWDVGDCPLYLSLVPFLSTQTINYIRSRGIMHVLELGDTSKFVEVWARKLERVPESVILTFHSAPVNDLQYQEKISRFRARLSRSTGKDYDVCFLSSRPGWLGPSPSQAHDQELFAVVGFLFENAETKYELESRRAITLSAEEVRQVILSALYQLNSAFPE